MRSLRWWLSRFLWCQPFNVVMYTAVSWLDVNACGVQLCEIITLIFVKFVDSSLSELCVNASLERWLSMLNQELGF